MHITILSGHLGDVRNGVEMKRTPKGAPYCVVPVAVNPPKGSGGDKPMWYRATLWNNVETAVKYAEKGKPIIIVGRPSIHEWTDREGRARHELEISASHWEYSGDGLSALFREAELVERESVVAEKERGLSERDGADDHT